MGNAAASPHATHGVALTNNHTTEHQPCWVLLSASADHPLQGGQKPLDDPTLVQARLQNRDNPKSLRQQGPPRRPRLRKHNCALLLTGELRCLSRSHALLQQLSKTADLFIVTTSAYGEAAERLTRSDQILIVDHLPAEANRDQRLPVGSMKQWHKLHLALQLVQNAEQRRGRRYSHLLKLRSDYFYAHPQHLIKDVIQQSQSPKGGLIGASDKVFGGPRDWMMLFQGFFQNLEGWFDDREQDYWPINLAQVLASDEALKWYGMNWPVELIGQPETTDAWRQRLREGGDDLATALAEFRPGPNTTYHRLFQGHPRFASEVSFARFLNFNGIPFRDCRSLRGFLYSDRNTCP